MPVSGHEQTTGLVHALADDAAQRVAGTAEDFCCLVAQWRALHDLDITADGDDSRR
jgi:hypothetical protein